jgi:hypothetical protein
MRIRPAARDELTMPTQHGRGRHQQRSPPGLPRQHAAERRKQGPVALRQLRTRDLPLKQPKLMTEKKNLDLLLPLRATPKNDQLEHAPKRPIQQRNPKRAQINPPRALTLPARPRSTNGTSQHHRTGVSGTHKVLERTKLAGDRSVALSRGSPVERAEQNHEHQCGDD